MPDPHMGTSPNGANGPTPSAAELSALFDVLEATEDRVWVVNTDARLVIANEAFHAHTAVTMRRPIKPGDLILPDDVPSLMREVWEGLFGRAFAGETFTHIRTTVMTPEPRIAEYRLRPVRDTDGTVTGAVVRARDITEAHHAKEALEAGERRYRAFIDASNDMAFLKDSRLRYVMVNRRNCEHFGATEAAIIGRTDEDFMPPEAAAGCRAGDMEALTAGAVVRREEAVGDRTYETVKYPVPLFDGSVGVGGLVRDVTDQRRAEEASRRSTQLFRDMAEQLTDVLCTTDRDGVLTYISPSCRTVFGQEPEAMLGHRFTEFVGPEAAASAMDDFVEVLDTGAGQRGRRVVAQRADGKRIHLEANAAPLYRDGRLVGGIGTVRDVTEQALAEADARRRTKLEALGTLAGGIAHDFNNIVHGLQGLVDELEAEIDGSGLGAGTIDALRAGCGRAADLVDRILAYGRASEQARTPQPLDAVVTEAVLLMRASIPRSIEVVAHVQPGCGLVMADAAQVHQLAMNLCTNGWQAMRATHRGTLTVTLEPLALTAEAIRDLTGHAVAGTEAALRPGAYAALRVADTGVGIPEDRFERIFDPYFSTRKDQDGSGLGLATVLTVARAHGAAVLLKSALGVGTTVSALFPVVAGAEAVAAPPAPRSAHGDPGGTEHVLLVDDEEVLTRVVRAGLTRLGYRVTAFTSPIEALSALRADLDGFGALVTDLSMVEMSGLTLAAEARALRADLPILLCTGYSERSDTEEAERLGVHAVLKKPIATRAIALAIRAAVAAVR